MSEWVDEDTGEVHGATLHGLSFQEVGSPEQIGKLYGALAKAQADFEPVHRNKQVTIRPREGAAYSFNYAPLEELLAATRPALAANGLAVLTPMVRDPNGATARVLVILAHAEGGRIAAAYDFQPVADMKQMAGQVTYLRRYGYGALLNLAGDDDADDHDAPVTETRRNGSTRNAAPKPTPAAPADQPAEPTPETKALEGILERLAEDVARASEPLQADPPADNSGPAPESMLTRYRELVTEAQRIKVNLKGLPTTDDEIAALTRARAIEVGTSLKDKIELRQHDLAVAAQQ